MLTILHGENTVKSRQALQQLLDTARASEKTIERVEIKKALPTQITELRGSESLFGTQKIIVIEELHSLPTSARKKELITAIDTISQDVEVIIWEKRLLTATMLKQFKHHQEQQFKASNSVFSWLDLLGTPNKQRLLAAFQEAISQEDEYFCFLMFARHIRMLIQAKDNAPIKGAPFMIAKLQKQAQPMTMPRLLAVHKRLTEIDIQSKQSKLRLTIAAELDILQLSL